MSSTEDAADWLVAKVGVGGAFTKEQLRAAFPGVTQIDRRVRDLRSRGWVIDTRREDPTLGTTEMRLVQVGGLDRPSQLVSSKTRREVLLSTAYTCILCGAPGSSTYPDALHVRVQLQVLPISRVPLLLVPVCLRCAPALQDAVASGEAPIPHGEDGLSGLSNSEWAAACRRRLLGRLLPLAREAD